MSRTIHTPAARRIALAGAVLTSAIGVGMAAAAAMDRGATLADRVLIMLAAVAITLAAHLLPALTRRAAGWGLWGACVLVTVYGHAVFFSSAAHRAGESRADSVQASGEAGALREQLASITARPVAIVAADLAAARSRHAGQALQLTRCEQQQPGQCGSRRLAAEQAGLRVQALQVEQISSEQAGALHAQLTANATQQDARRQAESVDPIAAALARITGQSADGAITALSLASALIVELLAALLWAEALSTPSQPAQAPRISSPPKARPIPLAAVPDLPAEALPKSVLVKPATRWPAATAPPRRKAPS